MRQRLPLILSITALIVAILGWTGVGEAAKNALVPKNSVGTKEVRNNQIRSVDIRDGTITGSDIRKATISLRHLGKNAIEQLTTGAGDPAGLEGRIQELESDLAVVQRVVNALCDPSFGAEPRDDFRASSLLPIFGCRTDLG